MAREDYEKRLVDLRESIQAFKTTYAKKRVPIVCLDQNIYSRFADYILILKSFFEINNIKVDIYNGKYDISELSKLAHSDFEKEYKKVISELDQPIYIYTPSFQYFISYIISYPACVSLKSIIFNGSERSKLFSDEMMDPNLTFREQATFDLATSVSENIGELLFNNSTASIIVQSMIDKGYTEMGFNENLCLLLGMPRDEVENIKKTKNEYNKIISGYIDAIPRAIYVNNGFLTPYCSKLDLRTTLSREGHYLMALNTFYHILDQKTGSNLVEGFQYSLKQKNN